MTFKVVASRHGDETDDALLRGIADGLGELFPVPQHPRHVLTWLSSAAGENGGGEQTPLQDMPPREMLHEA